LVFEANVFGVACACGSKRSRQLCPDKFSAASVSASATPPGKSRADELLTQMHPGTPDETQDLYRTMLHRLVHNDPAGSIFNMFERHNGVQVFACGKMVDQPTMCSLISVCRRHYLERLIGIAQEIFPEPAGSP
jgi:hypothetical protein